MKRWLAVLLVFAVVPASGCYHYRGELPGVLRRVDAREYEVVGDFDVRIERKWWAFGMIKLGHGDMREKVREAVREKGGDGAVNVEIVTEIDGRDVLWTALLMLALLGQSRHMEVRGQVIKFKDKESSNAQP